MNFIEKLSLLTEQEVGDIYEHYRLTAAGVTDTTTGFWYFLRKYEGKENPYWYKKKRLDPTESNPEGKIVEYYVGLDLPFVIPRPWINRLRRRLGNE